MSNGMKIINNGSKKGNGNDEFDVVVIGEINVDLILNGDVVPVFGQVEKIIDGATLNMGSSAVIFACGAARLGLATAFIGVVGNDIFGHFMINEMAVRGIDTTGVLCKPEIDTGLSVILSKENDRAILTFPGSIPALHYSDIDFTILARSKHIHLASYFLLDGLRPDIPQLLRHAHELGLSTSLDTNYDPLEQWNGGLRDVLPYVDIFFPNETEILALTNADNLAGAVMMLSSYGTLPVVKLGEKGAVTRNQAGELISQETVPVDVVDTVGAGDSFDAGFIYGYIHEMGLEKSLKLATICGSLSTRGPGGTGAQPTLEETQKYI
jgi:sugar/nucleoside kinase (ribokinase family)